ncbi:hypothetical protein A6C57_26175 [Fibrella sp. ES10-3-2-2]
MAIKQITVNVLPANVGETVSVEIATDKPTEAVRGVEALELLTDAMQQIIAQMKG